MALAFPLVSIPLSISTAALSLPSRYPFRRSVAITTLSIRRPGAVCRAARRGLIYARSPYDFGWEPELPIPPMRIDILPEFGPTRIPLPPPLPADPPLEHIDEDEEEEEYYYYPEEDDPDDDDDDDEDFEDFE